KCKNAPAGAFFWVDSRLWCGAVKCLLDLSLSQNEKKGAHGPLFFLRVQALLLGIIPFGVACVELTRTSNLVGSANHFVPVSEPADSPGHGKDHCKHGGRNANGT